MTIKEMEERSGMGRANIRFYEAEGLLAPGRTQNGYRNYSEQDLDVLLRIKLLRSLQIPLEQIKALQDGSCELAELLARHLVLLEQNRAELDRSQQVCRAMRSDGARYQTLDARHYLDAIAPPAQPDAPPQWNNDLPPRLVAPWRRFWARGLDYMLYTVLWNVFLAVGLRVNLAGRSGLALALLDFFAPLALMLLVEPVLLALFGATPGKWILGLRVAGKEEGRLSYADALARTRQMLWYGMGLDLPIYRLVRMWRCKAAHESGEPLDWEDASTLTLRDTRPWRYVAMVGAHAALFALLALAVLISRTPRHRGAITLEQFCQNYNQYATFYGIVTPLLDNQGHWLNQSDDGVTTVIVGGTAAPDDAPAPEYTGLDGDGLPRLSFTEQDGVLTGIRLEVGVAHGGADEWADLYDTERLLAALAFLAAQPGHSLFCHEEVDLANRIQAGTADSFTAEIHGVAVTCRIEYDGYLLPTPTLGALWPLENASDRSCTVLFSLER